MSDSPLVVDALLLDRYIVGECSAAERMLAEHWTAQDPQHAQQLADAQFILERTRHPIAQLDYRPAWQSWIQQSTEAERATPVRRQWYALPMTGRWLGAMAAALVFIGIGLTVVTQRINAGSHLARYEYATARAERLMITLPDGTRLALAPESRVLIAKEYGMATREIRLEGEAYFSVVHDDSRPFIVRTSQAVTRDIGTSFDLRAYPEDASTRVAVMEGAVDIASATCVSRLVSADCNAVIRQGDVAFAEPARVGVEHHADVARYAEWQQGRLVFDAVPLREVARELSRTFDVQIAIADSAMNREEVTGDFHNVPVDRALDEITRMIGAHFEHRGRNVIIRPRSSGASSPPNAAPTPLATAMRPVVDR